MADVFEGSTDARQTDEPKLKPYNTLFRKRYRQLSESELALHDAIKDKADELARLIGNLNTPVYEKLVGSKLTDVASIGAPRDPAQVTLAMRHLEDAVYRAVKALTA